MRRIHTEAKKHQDFLKVASFFMQKATKKQYRGGMTLLEVVLVVAVVSVLAVGSINVYFNTIRSTDMDTAVTGIMADLRYARGQAMSGADDKNWGVRLINNSADYFEVFSTPSGTIDHTTYLPASVHFTEPAGTESVLFSKITGLVAAPMTITVANDVGNTKSIVVDALGNAKKQ